MGASGAATPGAIGGEAKTALDSGNILFRAKAYDRALVQYRRTAQLAPNEAAPLLGILMVADVTKNAKLADSTLARLRALNPAAADSSAAMSQAEILAIHSGTRKAPPPPPAKKH
jgi:Flp pilus assembly protein TadD